MSNLISVILAVIDEDGFELSVNNFEKRMSHFSGTQLIIADRIKSEKTDKLCDRLKAKYQSRVCVIDCAGLSLCQSYNKAIPEVNGKYVNFTLSGVTLGRRCMGKVHHYMALHPGCAVTMQPVTVAKDESLKKYARFLSTSTVTKLSDEPFYGQLALFGYFFRTEDISSLSFDTDISDEGLKKYIFEALLRNGSVVVSQRSICCCIHALENDSALFSGQYEKSYYTESLRNFMIPFMQQLKEQYGKVPEFVQYGISQLICAKYRNNYYENNKGVLEGNEISEFFDATCDALMYIDNNIFTNAAINSRYILRSLWMLLLNSKCDKAQLAHSAELVGDNIVYRCEGCDDARLTTLEGVSMVIHVINYNDGKLEFDAEFTGKDFINTEDIKLWASYGNEKQMLGEYQSYPLLRCFDVTYARRYNVHFFIPVTDALRDIRFYYSFGGTDLRLPVHFAGHFSRLRLRFSLSYWKFCDSYAITCMHRNSLRVFRINPFKRFFREIGLMTQMFFFTRKKFFAVQCIGMRLIYWATRPSLSKQRIWMTFDKLYKAGDNGEYFFRYSNTVKDDVQTYYVISDTSPDCGRLTEYDREHTLIHGTLNCRLKALNAEVIVATHTLVMQYCGFPNYLVPFYVDLFNAKVVCIQHGLTVQQLAQYQRRNYDNTTLYCLASKYEKQNLLHPIYGYEESMLKIDGLARYDGLKNNDKKQILITPTWRRNVVTLGIAYKKKPYNEHFKKTEYFRLYNELIHDEKLITCAKEHGYSVIYLLHPAMSPQLPDFDTGGFVKVIAAAGDMNYEKILTESSLMVTDYSGVQFDFAYMRKPIVYYHPDTLPPHYEAGGIDYNTQGFGPIITTHNALVDEICRYMETGCKTSDEYIARADDFFAFSDRNNCERIYRDIYSFSGNGKTETE